MGINATVDTMRKQEKLSIARSKCDSDRFLRTRPLQNKAQSILAVKLGKYVTQKAVGVLDEQIKRADKMSYVQLARGRWHVRYTNTSAGSASSSAATGEAVSTPSSLVDDSDSDDDADENVIDGSPWPKFLYTREVYERDGKLYCSCRFAESMLLPCRHILCVKNGTASEQDCHFRWSLAWQAGRIPLAVLHRTAADQAFGVTLDGVVESDVGTWTEAMHDHMAGGSSHMEFDYEALSEHEESRPSPVAYLMLRAVTVVMAYVDC
jgi:hypothetical protein